MFLAAPPHAMTHSHKTILRMYTCVAHVLHYTGSSSNCSFLKNLVHGFSLCSAATRAETSARVCVKIATLSAVEANWATVRPRRPLNPGHVASAAMHMSACWKRDLPLASPAAGSAEEQDATLKLWCQNELREFYAGIFFQ